MKTHTEIPGIPLREIFRWRVDLVRAKKAEPKRAPAPEITAPETTIEATPAAPPAEPHIKSPEERVAELEKRRAAERDQQKKEWQELVAATKDALAAQIKEKFQWSDERIQLACESLDMVDRKRVEDLRRIIVLKQEKPEDLLPRFAQRSGEYAFVVEYLPSKFAPQEREPRRGDHKGKGNRGGGKFGPKRDGKPGEQRAPRPQSGRPVRPGERKGPPGPASK